MADYSMYLNGELILVTEKFMCFDQLHKLGKEVGDAAYTLTYDSISQATMLLMETEEYAAVCIKAML